MPRYRKLGYVALNVTDLPRACAFYEGMVGLRPNGWGGLGEAFFRCCEDHHSIVLFHAAEPGLKRIRFEIEDDAGLDRLASNLSAHGIDVSEVCAEERQALRQGRSVKITDPFTGAALEFYVDIEQASDLFAPTLAEDSATWARGDAGS